MGSEGEGPDRYESMRIEDTYDNIGYQEHILKSHRFKPNLDEDVKLCSFIQKLQKSQIKNFLKLKPEIQTTSNETM